MLGTVAVTMSVTLLAVIGFTNARSMVDLTHTLDENAPKYPLGYFGIKNFTYYKMETMMEQYVGDSWIELRKMEFYEHQGTHIDAPNHFGKGRQMLNEIPLSRLIGPGVVIDVRDKVKMNADYAVTVEDIREHEAKHGRIPPDAIIMMNSGWSYRYPNPEKIFGTNNISDPTTFHFPGWSLEACEMLLQDRRVSVLGVDTPSTDPGQKDQYYCHMFLQPNNVPLLEYVANLDRIPQRGTTIVLGTMKVRRGTGGPTRIFALFDSEDEKYFNAAGRVMVQSMYMMVATLFMYLL